MPRPVVDATCGLEPSKNGCLPLPCKTVLRVRAAAGLLIDVTGLVQMAVGVPSPTSVDKLGVVLVNTGSYLTMAGHGIADGAPFNEIHQSDPTWQSTYAKALATVDKNARDELVKELMKFDYDKGGYIIPVYFPGIEGMTSRVGGVSENITGIPINGGSGWQNIWLQGS